MRTVLSLVALVMTVGAAPQSNPQNLGPSASLPRYLAEAAKQPANCRDRIVAVREERGLPRLDDKIDPPLLISAVATQIDGCSVLVMHGNRKDVRPLPSAGKPRLMPAR